MEKWNYCVEGEDHSKVQNVGDWGFFVCLFFVLLLFSRVSSLFNSAADDSTVNIWWCIVTDCNSQSVQKGATHTLSSLCLVTSKKDFSVLLYIRSLSWLW